MLKSKFQCWILCQYIFLLIHEIFSQNENFSPPYVFLQQPVDGTLELEGNYKILPCSANGIPQPRYSWLKNGGFYKNVSTDSMLKLQNIKVQDAGVYQCIASNSLGSILSNKATVTVVLMGNFYSSSSQMLSCSEGDSLLLLPPKLDSVPAASFQWRDASTQYSGELLRYHVTLRNELAILEARQSLDNGKVFNLRATNTYIDRMVESDSFNIIVTESRIDIIKPQFIISPLNTSVIQGIDNMIKLECVANAKPISSLILTWYRMLNSSPIKINIDKFKYMLSTYSRVLTINNPMVEDAGAYICQAAYLSSSALTDVINTTAYVRVYVKPSFIITPPSTLTAILGTSILIPCFISATPSPSITWYKNAQPVYSDRYFVQNNGSLLINMLQQSDAAVFQCFIKNPAGELSAATWLQIQNLAPAIITFPLNQSALIGDKIVFTCSANGAPVPIIRWFKVSNRSVSNELLPSLNYLIGKDSLTLTNVSKVDGGLYECTALNDAGEDNAYAFLDVKEKTKINSMQPFISAVKGSTASLPCGVFKDESINVSWYWYFGTTNVKSGTRYRLLSNGTLEIMAVRNEDMGIYVCFVRSIAGNDTTRMNLTITELPYPPRIFNISLVNDSSSVVRIFFRPDFDGFSPIKRFIVRYLDVTAKIIPVSCSSLWTMALDNVAMSATVVDVHGLLPSRSYSFCMSAVSDVGEGESAQFPLPVSIPQIAPSGAPIGLWGSVRSSSSIVLQWKAPDPSTWNGQLLGYNLRYKLSGYPDVTLTNVNITPFQETVTYELNNLIVWQEYNISVAAFNMKGVGLFSGSYFVRTDEGLPTHPPSDISVKVLSSTEAIASWGPPAVQSLNGVLMGYLILLKEGIDRVTEHIVSKNITLMIDASSIYSPVSKQLMGLQKYMQYSFQISCFTLKGSGPLSIPLIFMTNEDVPDKVENLKIVQISDKKLQIIWDPPTNSNGIIIGYRLMLLNVNVNNTVQLLNVGNDTFNHTFYNLTPLTSYLLEVGAFTKIGISPLEMLDILTTETPVLPTPPTDLVIINITSDTLVLAFTLGSNGHAPIINWIAELQLNSNSEWMRGDLIVRQESINKIVVKNLKPNKRFRIRLTAENIVGKSETSVATEWFQTPPSSPLVSPSIISFMPISPTSIRLRWDPLATDDWGGGEDDRAYLIEWKEKENNAFVNTQRISDGGTFFFDVAPLKAYTKYDVRIAAANKLGAGKYSALSMARTLESVPSKSPSNISATAVNSTCIYIMWQPVDQQYCNGMLLGYKVSYWFNDNILEMKTNASFIYANDLLKYTLYYISIAAYTIEGNGPTSQIITIQSPEDVPGAPSSVYFSAIAATSATLKWSPPSNANGIITGYSVSYGTQASPPVYTSVLTNLSSSDQTVSVSGLDGESNYLFALKARTQIGWGEEVVLLLCSSVAHDAPSIKVTPKIIESSISSRSMMITWNQTNSNEYLSLRNISVLQSTNGRDFQPTDFFAFPLAPMIAILKLHPDTLYSFRLVLSNDWGSGDPSIPSDIRKTIMEIPSLPPENLQLQILTATSIKATWAAPPDDALNGPVIGYQVFYRSYLNVDVWLNASTTDPSMKYLTIGGLQIFVMYEIKVAAVNSIGTGPFSQSKRILIEIAPLELVAGVRAENVTSTSFKLRWNVPSRDTNYNGYKIYIDTMKELIVEPSSNSTVIDGLKPFERYNVNMLLFNSAGNGPLAATPIIVETKQDVPSKVDSVRLIVTTLSSVNVSWVPPTQQNGVVTSYELLYYQNVLTKGMYSNVVLHLPNVTTHYHVTQLVENANYVFGVKAATLVGFGEVVYTNVTVAPQLGSPGQPSRPICLLKNKFLVISWSPNNVNLKPILSTILQHKTTKELKWTSIEEVKGDATTQQVDAVAYDSKEEHLFRIINVNEVGVGVPSEPSDVIKTIDLLAELDRPFYQQWWFLIIIALVIIIVIIIVIALLCAKGRKKKKVPTATLR